MRKCALSIAVCAMALCSGCAAAGAFTVIGGIVDTLSLVNIIAGFFGLPPVVANT